MSGTDGRRVLNWEAFIYRLQEESCLAYFRGTGQYDLELVLVFPCS